MKLIIIACTLVIIVAASIILFYKMRRRYEQGHPTTLKGKLQLTGFTFGIWIVIVSIIILGLSTSALGWQVLSIWLVKGILVLAAILTVLTYGTFHKKYILNKEK